MFDVTRSFYKSSPSYGGMLYAWFPSMHTRTDIILCGKQTKKELLLVVDAIYERLSYIEKLGNCYDADSELARLNRVAALRPQPVSCELYDMLAFCMDCHTRTDGFFDITVHSELYAEYNFRYSVVFRSSYSFFSTLGNQHQSFWLFERICIGKYT